jgi:hypothetical protein
MPCLRGTICRLEDRPCPFVARGRSFELPFPPSTLVLLSLAPIEMIDTERLCPPFPFLIPLTGAPFHESVVRWDRTEGGGTFNDKLALWPLSDRGGRGRGLAEPFFPCTLVAFLGLSPSAKPFPAADEGCSEDREGVVIVAMFLKVISHSTSSPAKTVCSVHCTNTLIFDNGVDIVDVRPKLAHLRVRYRRYTRGSLAQR